MKMFQQQRHSGKVSLRALPGVGIQATWMGSSVAIRDFWNLTIPERGQALPGGDL